MDALSNVLRTMHLTGGVFLHAEFFDPWCLSVKALPQSCAPYLGGTAEVIPYHFVLEGRMRVRIANSDDFEMEPGESVLFPRNDLHLLGSDLGRTPVDAQTVIQRSPDGMIATIVFGGNGPATRIVCGFLGGEALCRNPIVNALPPALRLDTRQSSAADWIGSTFRHAAAEISAARMGSQALMAKLSELLFVEAITAYTATLPEQQTGWLAGLRDPYLARAMALLHGKPAYPWTVEELAQQSGLSRSALAERFGAIIGMPPIQYLAAWRLNLAAYELLHTPKSILQVAQEVGYDTEAAFSRAFKRVIGSPPATWRRERK
jgi:AraC-like DNA-binding protein